jgi:serine/threonine protein kinase
MLAEVASSLEYMHRISLLHGDVKLDNILLKSDPIHALGVSPKVRPRARAAPSSQRATPPSAPPASLAQTHPTLAPPPPLPPLPLPPQTSSSPTLGSPRF